MTTTTNLPTEPAVGSDLYWGDESVLSVVDGVIAGEKRVSTDKGSFDVPAWEATVVISSVKSDASEVRRLRTSYVASQILDLLHNVLDVRIEEIGHYFQLVIKSLQDSEEVAKLVGLGIYSDLYPNIQMAKLDVRLSTLNNVLLKQPPLPETPAVPAVVVPMVDPTIAPTGSAT